MSELGKRSFCRSGAGHGMGRMNSILLFFSPWELGFVLGRNGMEGLNLWLRSWEPGVAPALHRSRDSVQPL